jgi:hypothetical protein
MPRWFFRVYVRPDFDRASFGFVADVFAGNCIFLNRYARDSGMSGSFEES